MKYRTDRLVRNGVLAVVLVLLVIVITAWFSNRQRPGVLNDFVGHQVILTVDLPSGGTQTVRGILRYADDAWFVFDETDSLGVPVQTKWTTWLRTSDVRAMETPRD